MSIPSMCPHCRTAFNLPDHFRGQRVRCKQCEKPFLVEDTSRLRAGEPRPSPRAPAATRRPPRDDWADEGDDRLARPRRRRPASSGSGALPWIIAGTAVGLLVLVVLGVAIAWFVSARPAALPAAEQAVAGKPTVAQAGAPDQPEAAPLVAAAPPGLYGDQGGEEILPADPRLPDALLRCRTIDTFFKLSNVHTGADRFGRPTLFIDYEKVRTGERAGFSLILHADDGRRQTVLLLGPMNQSRGTLEIHAGFRGFGPPSFPKNLEVYLEHADMRYGMNAPHFKVSNSAVMGTMPKLTPARNWTKEEIDRLTKPPPNYANANAHPDVGKDTPFAGDTTGGGSLRLVEPGGLLLGLEWRPGEWDQEKCLGGVVPIFSRAQPATQPQRVLAREGYAVGGFKVQSKKFVDAVQVMFLRIKPDGRLDPADSYTSDWLGFPGKDAPKLLGGDGTRVIGLHCRQGAILNGIALVLDGEGGGKP